MKMEFLAFLVTLGLLCGTTTGYFFTSSQYNKVKMAKIQTLIFYDEFYTTARRVPAVPQLNCVGGTYGCDKFTPSTVQCRNAGKYNHLPKWDCKAEMPGTIKFGKVKVSCEGFDDVDDPYVLVGSCALEYSLDFVDKPGFVEKMGKLAFILLILCIIFLIGMGIAAGLANCRNGNGFWSGFFAALTLFRCFGRDDQNAPTPGGNAGGMQTATASATSQNR